MIIQPSDLSGMKTGNAARILNTALSVANVREVRLPPGEFQIDETINKPWWVTLRGDQTTFNVTGRLSTVLQSPTPQPTRIGGIDRENQRGSVYLSVSKTTEPVKKGDILQVTDPTDRSWSDHRAGYRAGEFVEVAETIPAGVREIPIIGTLQGEYISGDVLNHEQRRTGDIEHLTIRTNAQTTKGMQLSLFGSSLTNVTVTGPRTIGTSIRKSYGVKITDCNMQDDLAVSPSSYGLVLSGCQNVMVSGGKYAAGRHPIAIGGNQGIVNRSIDVTRANLVGMSNIQAADCHGNSEHVKYDNCHIDGGILLRGDNCQVVHCRIRQPRGRGATVALAELKGATFEIANNLIEVMGNSPSRGAAVDTGGNSVTGLNDKTSHGGTITIQNNRIANYATTPVSGMIRLVNRGYPGSDVDVVIKDNQSTVRGLGARKPISVEPMKGPFGDVIERNNLMPGRVRIAV